LGPVKRKPINTSPIDDIFEIVDLRCIRGIPAQADIRCSAICALGFASCDGQHEQREDIDSREHDYLKGEKCSKDGDGKRDGRCNKKGIVHVLQSFSYIEYLSGRQQTWCCDN